MKMGLVMATDTGARADGDADLLADYARGDRAAARALTVRLTPVALRVAQRMLGDAAEAEDVAQEAMLRLWRAAPGWREGEAKVTTWLYRVTANLCTDRLRRRRTVALDAVAEPEDGRPGAVPGMIAADRMAAPAPMPTRIASSPRPNSPPPPCSASIAPMPTRMAR